MAVIWEKVYSLPAPRQIYTFLDLSKNQLSGDVPDNIGGLKSLKLLSISYNKLSGRIPISFDDLESLESLDLSHSTLSGEVPRTFEKLLQLTVLELSDNKLKGRIPNDPRIHSTIKVLMLTIAGSVECKFRYHVRRNRQGWNWQSQQQRNVKVRAHGFLGKWWGLDFLLGLSQQFQLRMSLVR